MSAVVDYSIVVPVYFNEGCLRPLLAALQSGVFEKSPYSGELIFVDDGSEDGSLRELQQIQAESSIPITILKLTRNFGQVPALLAGYGHVRGRCAITMSADGQDPPELITEMLEH